MSLPPIYLQLKQFLENAHGSLTTLESSIISAEIEGFITEIPGTFHELASLPRSLSVEIHKQLHLLKNDLFFWRAARHDQTKAQRWQQIEQRLGILATYMQQLSNLGQLADE